MEETIVCTSATNSCAAIFTSKAARARFLGSWQLLARKDTRDKRLASFQDNHSDTGLGLQGHCTNASLSIIARACEARRGSQWRREGH